MWLFSSWMIPYFMTAFGLFLLGVFTLTRHRVKGASAFSFVLLGASVWAMFSGGKLGALSLDQALWFDRLEFLGSAILTVAWMQVVFLMTDKQEWCNWKMLFLLAILPALTVLMAFFDPFSGWFYVHPQLIRKNAMSVFLTDMGPFFWVWALYSYVIFLWGGYLLIRSLNRADSFERPKFLLLSISTLIPMISNTADLLLSGWFQYEITPFFFAISCVLMIIAIFRYQMFSMGLSGYAALIQNMDDGMVLLNSAGEIIETNREAQRVFNLSGSVKGIEFFAIFPQEIVASFQNFVVNGSQQSPDVVQIKGRIYEIHWHLVTGASKEALGQLLQVRDITAQRQVAEALQKTEKKYQRLFEDAVIGIFQSTVDGRMVTINPAFAKIFGYDTPELFMQATQGKSSLLYTQPKHREEIIQKVMEHEGPVMIEYDFLHRSGKTFPGFLSIWKVWDEQTHLYYLEGFLEDASERKKTERFILQQNAYLEVLNQTALALINHTDVDQILDSILKYASRLTGTPNAWIYLVEEVEGNRFLVVHSASGIFSGDIGYQMAIGEGLSGHALQVGKTLQVRDYLQWEGRSYTRNVFHAAVAVPLKNGDEVVGVLGLVHTDEETTFSNEDVRFLERFGTLASLSLQNTRLQMTLQAELETRKKIEMYLRESEERYRALYHQTPVMLQSINQAYHLTLVSEYWLESLKYSRDDVIGKSLVEFIHPSSRWFFLDVVLPELFHNGSVKEIPCQMVKKTGEKIDVLISMLGEKDTEGNWVGAMGVAVDVTQQKQAQEQVQRHLRRLSSLRAVEMSITASMDLRLILEVLLEQVTSQLEVDAAVVLLLNPYEKTLNFAASRGFKTNKVHEACVPLGKSLAGRAAKDRNLVFVSLPLIEIENPDLKTMLEMEGFSSYYGIPLVAKGTVKGVLELYNRVLLEPAPEWLEFLEALAAQAAIAIENASLLEGLQSANLRLVSENDSVVQGWAQSMELGEIEPDGHIEQTLWLMQRLAQQMKIPGEREVHIRRGVLLHDVGKMSIPERVLKKPGPLDEAEWALVRQHPQIAFDILSKIEFLKEATEIPYCHHERWDGMGYPRGLKETEIPFEARLFSVVETWDLLRRDLPYRQALTPQQAIEEIRRQSGRQFDPAVVDVFLRFIQTELSRFRLGGNDEHGSS